MDIQIEAQKAVLQDLVSTLQDHEGGRLRSGKYEPKKVEVKAEEEELPGYDADERLLKFLRGK